MSNAHCSQARQLIEQEVLTLATDTFNHIMKVISISPPNEEVIVSENFTPDELDICSSILRFLKLKFPVLEAKATKTQIVIKRPPDMDLTEVERVLSVAEPINV
jgi:hypothetical protein